MEHQLDISETCNKFDKAFNSSTLPNKYNDITGNEYIYLGEEFHEDIKFVHFTHSLNKPHLWEDYSIHV